jgi:hypothetical protein
MVAVQNNGCETSLFTGHSEHETHQKLYYLRHEVYLIPTNAHRYVVSGLYTQVYLQHISTCCGYLQGGRNVLEMNLYSKTTYDTPSCISRYLIYVISS